MEYYDFHKNSHKDNSLWTSSKRDPDEWQAETCMILFRQDDIDKERYKKWIQEPGGKERFEFIKKSLREIDPRINEEYWEDLRNGKVDEGYWDIIDTSTFWGTDHGGR